jgi:hypothetical protein
VAASLPNPVAKVSLAGQAPDAGREDAPEQYYRKGDIRLELQLILPPPAHTTTQPTRIHLTPATGMSQGRQQVQRQPAG